MQLACLDGQSGIGRGRGKPSAQYGHVRRVRRHDVGGTCDLNLVGLKVRATIAPHVGGQIQAHCIARPFQHRLQRGRLVDVAKQGRREGANGGTARLRALSCVQHIAASLQDAPS